MRLESVEIENYRAIEKLRLLLHPTLTVLHGDNTCPCRDRAVAVLGVSGASQRERGDESRDVVVLETERA